MFSSHAQHRLLQMRLRNGWRSPAATSTLTYLRASGPKKIIIVDAAISCFGTSKALRIIALIAKVVMFWFDKIREFIDFSIVRKFLNASRRSYLLSHFTAQKVILLTYGDWPIGVIFSDSCQVRRLTQAITIDTLDSNSHHHPIPYHAMERHHSVRLVKFK